MTDGAPMSVAVKDVISLNFFKPEYNGLLEDYQLHEGQMKYTALPIDALAKCEVDPGRHPVVILYGNKLAGFFVLHGRDGTKAYSDNQNAILLRAYSVNTAFQGKGVAKCSMGLLPSFVKKNFPSMNEIILAVNHANKIAQHVYFNSGFIDKGIRAMGSEGEMFILHMEI